MLNCLSHYFLVILFFYTSFALFLSPKTFIKHRFISIRGSVVGKYPNDCPISHRQFVPRSDSSRAADLALCMSTDVKAVADFHQRITYLETCDVLREHADSMMDLFDDLISAQTTFASLQVASRRSLLLLMCNAMDQRCLDLVKFTQLLLSLRFSYKTITSSDLKSHFLTSVSSQLPHINDYQLVTALRNFIKLDINWHDFNESFKEELKESMNRNMNKMSGTMLSSFVWSLGNLQTRWEMLNTISRQAIFDQIVNLGDLRAQSLSSLIYGLNKMRLVWAKIPKNVQIVLFDNFPTTVELNEQIVANIIYSLCQMKVSMKDLSDYDKLRSTNRTSIKFINRITSAFQHVSGNFTPQGLSNALLGLSKIGFTSAHLSADVIVDTLCPSDVQSKHSTNFETLNAQSFSNIIWSLGRMKYTWYSRQRLSNDTRFSSSSHLSYQFCQQALTRFDDLLSVVNEQALSSILHGLANVSVHWHKYCVVS
jgi:hypothetical protein